MQLHCFVTYDYMHDSLQLGFIKALLSHPLICSSVQFRCFDVLIVCANTDVHT